MNVFDSIVGNEKIKLYLKRMVETKSLGTSLLFAGPDGVGKSLFAKALATLLLGSENHPDLHLYYPEGKVGLHSISSLKQFCHDVYLAPYTGQKKVFIIHHAERMLPTSSNALLKTFEEPAEDAVIILVSSTPDALLPTILSRCRIIRFQSMSEAEIALALNLYFGQTEDNAKRLAVMAQGSLNAALRFVEGKENEMRHMILEFLAKGKMETFKELSHAADAISEKVNQLKKSCEESLENKMSTTPQENLSATQLQSVEKGIDGMVAIHTMHDAQAVFDVILGWYRDLQLLHVNGNKNLLFHRDFGPFLEQSLQRGEILPLDQVQKAINQAKLSLERSTSLNNCLENLLLQLNLL
jgi:DNA polymerase III subunit delta'